MRKLSEQQKLDIIEKYKSGGHSHRTLGKEYGVDRSTIQDLLKRRGVKSMNTSRKYTINEHYFDVIDTEEKAYWLGFLYADGNNNEVDGVVTMGLIDKEILEIFKWDIGSNKPLYLQNKHGKQKDIHVMSMCSKHLSKTLFLNTY